MQLMQRYNSTGDTPKFSYSRLKVEHKSEEIYVQIVFSKILITTDISDASVTNVTNVISMVAY